ncbi:MAG: manganese efflux pump MntP family protein [Dysosmobacter sp.]
MRWGCLDAFAVSVCKGLSTQTLQRRHYLIVGAWFGGFQALMPTLGYLLGSTFEQYITSVDHWVKRFIHCCPSLAAIC